MIAGQRQLVAKICHLHRGTDAHTGNGIYEIFAALRRPLYSDALAHQFLRLRALPLWLSFSRRSSVIQALFCQLALLLVLRLLFFHLCP